MANQSKNEIERTEIRYEDWRLNACQNCAEYICEFDNIVEQVEIDRKQKKGEREKESVVTNEYNIDSVDYFA